MISGFQRAGLAAAIALAMTGGASAQPQTKLVSQLDKTTIQAIWCSSLMFENSFSFDEGSDDSIRYEDMAFEIGDEIDTVLLDELGMLQVEVDEVWSLFDDEAFGLNAENRDDFLAQLAVCESSYDDLL